VAEGDGKGERAVIDIGVEATGERCFSNPAVWLFTYP